MLGFFKKKKEPLKHWRDEQGAILCSGDQCQFPCDDTCPIRVNREAEKRIRARKYTDAMHLLKRALELAPDYADAYANRAACLAAMSRHKEAAESLKKAMELGYQPSAEDAAAAWMEMDKGIYIRHTGASDNARNAWGSAVGALQEELGQEAETVSQNAAQTDTEAAVPMSMTTGTAGTAGPDLSDGTEAEDPSGDSMAAEDPAKPADSASAVIPGEEPLPDGISIPLMPKRMLQYKTAADLLEKLLKLGSDQGAFRHPEHPVHIFVLELEAPDVTRKIYAELRRRYPKTQGLEAFTSALNWCALAGIGGVCLWKEDEHVLKRKSLYQLMTEEHGIEMLDEYAVTLAGCRYGTNDSNLLLAHIKGIARSAFTETIKVHKDVLDTQMTESLKAMFLYGLLLEADRMKLS